MRVASWRLAALGTLAVHGFQIGHHHDTCRSHRQCYVLVKAGGGRESDEEVGRRAWVAVAGVPLMATVAGILRTSKVRADDSVLPPASSKPEASAGASDLVAYAEGFPSDATVPYKGKQLPLSRLLGKATIFVNIKTDDPASGQQMPPLAYLSTKYAGEGLRIIAFPTDQGWFEPDVAELVRIRTLQNHGFGSFPVAVVTDKVDILGETAHPLFKYMMGTLPNPNGRNAVSLNFEKFLLDPSGRVLRRYPRKFDGYQMEGDVKAVLMGQPLPALSPDFLGAWKDAEREAMRSEYAFRMGYNVYKQKTASTDWEGIAKDGFR